jgi:hypothetical protein
MSILSRNLDLRKPEDQAELLERLSVASIHLDQAALHYALSVLSEDWFELAAGLDICSLKSGSKHSEAISLAVWVSVIQSLHEFRNHKNIDTQIQRLRIPSHEKLDTLLVLQVARRYRHRGCAVDFEPFGEGSTDLLISRDLYRLYAEIKRENPGEHRRLRRVQEISGIINGRVDAVLRAWLKERQFRVEVKISKLFSNPHAEKVVEEICAITVRSSVGLEREMQSVAGSKMIVLQKDAKFHYQKGIHSGIVRVEVAGKAIPVFAPSSTPIRCTFGLKPNLTALGQRIRQAGKQLDRDLTRDDQAAGLIVLECIFGEEDMVDAIQKRFWSRLPARCWGVTLISPRGWIIPRSDLSPDQAELLRYAALNPAPSSPSTPDNLGE